jgi:hypothetical protein
LPSASRRAKLPTPRKVRPTEVVVLNADRDNFPRLTKAPPRKRKARKE